ncbi:MAG: NTP transferase domain-containing protein [Rhodobacteraceae bacterium]|jgi:molybdenum cofactor cytidylyltransferase|nr:NTP transferase domain-containing protein [Paracoccaceae bacterium]
MALLGVLLAAGASRRFGPDDKLLAPFAGRPLVLHAAATLMALAPDRLVAVVSAPAVANILPPAFERRFVPAGGALDLSFHAAIDAASAQDERLMICLGDMPCVPLRAFRALLALPGSGACLCDGQRMPPLLLARADYAAARSAASGDSGGRRFLAGLPADRLVTLARPEGRDIDRPADLSLPDG